MAGSIILRITYGYKITTDDDELIDIAKQAGEIGLELHGPGWIIDAVPWREYVHIYSSNS